MVEETLRGSSKNSISAYLFPFGETGMRYQKEMIEFFEVALRKIKKPRVSRGFFVITGNSKIISIQKNQKKFPKT